MAAFDPGTGRLSQLAALGPVVLASASPRRADLLRAEGLEFEVCAAELPEDPLVGESPAALCERLALAKAASVAGTRAGGCVIGGDTIVVRDGEVLGKPLDRRQAESMLRSLAGRRHEVLSGVALSLAPDGPARTAVARSSVLFAPLDEDQLRRYLDGDEWRGKAGGYAIQGRAAGFASLVDGEQDTVVGLPVGSLARLARQLSQAATEERP